MNTDIQNIVSDAASQQSAAANLQITLDALTAQLDNAKALLNDDTNQIATLTQQIATLQTQLASFQKPTMRSLLYPGFKGEIVGHIEMSSQPHAPGLSYPHPVDMHRWMGFDQHNPDDVALDCLLMWRTGIGIAMPNSYAIGSFEDKALLLYLPALAKQNMLVFPNVDKNIYNKAANRQQAIQAYLDQGLRKRSFPLGNNVTWNGKLLVSIFDDGTTPKAVFDALAKANPDIEFVLNVESNGGSQYSWMKFGLGTGYPGYFEGWLKNYAAKHDGHLYLPHIGPGGDDSLNGHSVWDPTKPARIYPAGGPNLDTLKWHFTMLNKYYSVNNPLAMVMAVTWSDLNEATRICPDIRGNGGYFGFER